MKIKFLKEEQKVYENRRRNMGYLLASVAGAILSYQFLDSIYYLGDGEDAIINNRITGKRYLVEESGIHFKLPFVEEKKIVNNVINLDYISDVTKVINEKLNTELVKIENYEQLLKLEDLEKIYGTNQKEELLKRLSEDFGLLNFGIITKTMYDLINTYKVKIVEEINNKYKDSLDNNLPTINNRAIILETENLNLIQTNFSVHGLYDGRFNTIFISSELFYNSLIYSTLASLDYNEDIKVVSKYYESLLFTTLLHEIIHSNNIYDEKDTQLLTLKICLDSGDNLGFLIRMNIIFSSTSDILKGKNELPSEKTISSFYSQYSLDVIKELLMASYFDNEIKIGIRNYDFSNVIDKLKSFSSN